LPTTRHCCNLEMWTLGTKSRRWAPLLVTPTRVLSEYNEDLISFCYFLLRGCP